MRRYRAIFIAQCVGIAFGLSGCQHPSVTAVSLNPHYCDHKFAFLYDPCKEPEGIPFYLPKPLLIVAKNFRNVEETKVGLTDSAPIPNFFDDQAKYADLNARTSFSGMDGTAAAGTPAQTSGPETFPTGDAKNLASVAQARVYSGTGAPVSPGEVAPDGLTPETFYTYHIVFVPDMTQKYGLKIRGGAGEIRAAMNLVNGWQFTGLGPYYMKDSSTAQNTLAAGITANLAASGVADVVKAVANLKPGVIPPGATKTAGTAPPSVSTEQVRSITDAMRQLHPKFIPIPAYAEISIYEPYISPEGTMEWKPIAEKSFNRDVLTTDLQPHQTMTMVRSAAASDAAARAGVTQPQQNIPPAPPKPAAAVPGGAPSGAAPPGAAASVNPKFKPRLAASSVGSAAGAGGHSGDLVMPRVEAPHASIPVGMSKPGTSMQPVQAGAHKVDDGVVRTQGTDAARLLPLDVLAQPGAAPQLRLSFAPNSGTINAGLTSSSTPLFEVLNAPPNGLVELFRDPGKDAVSHSPTGGGGVVQIRDEAGGGLSSGNYTYTATVTRADGTEMELGPLAVRVIGRPAVTTPTLTTSPLTGVSTPTTSPGAVPAVSGPSMAGATWGAMPIDSELLRNMFVRAGVLPGATPTQPPGSTVATGAAPSATNQINLNQYFGKTKVAAPAGTPAARRFSLFHHQEKARPKSQTVALSGLESAAATAGPAVAPPVR
jgi:hypothetical protein